MPDYNSGIFGVIQEMVMKKDIVVIGAGPAGLSFASSLADTELDVLIIERQPLADLSDPMFDGRDIALTHCSQKLMMLSMQVKIAQDIQQF